MLRTLLSVSKNLIYKKISPAHFAPTIITIPTAPAKPVSISPKKAADLSFRIEMCIASGQIQHLEQHHTQALPPLLLSVVRDLDRLRQHAPAEEIKYRMLLAPRTDARQRSSV